VGALVRYNMTGVDTKAKACSNRGSVPAASTYQSRWLVTPCTSATGVAVLRLPLHLPWNALTSPFRTLSGLVLPSRRLMSS